jgi:hypothetical protein
MDTQETSKQAKALRARLGGYLKKGIPGATAQVCECLRTYAGPKSAFLAEAEKVDAFPGVMIAEYEAILDSFVEYLDAGLATGMSPERQGQLAVVSDILSQAQSILEDDQLHPAAAAMLIGASLEEFLRTWVEEEELSLGEARPGLDAYAKVLRANELVTKQDVKDITSWAGIRNHAAHGQWDDVSDRPRICEMLEGVGLFIRRNEKASCG